MPKIDWISIFFEEEPPKNRKWLTSPYMGGYKAEYLAYVHLSVQIIMAIFAGIVAMTMALNFAAQPSEPLTPFERAVRILQTPHALKPPPLTRPTGQALEEIRDANGSTALEGAIVASYFIMGLPMLIGLPFAITGMHQRLPVALLPMIFCNGLQTFAMTVIYFALNISIAKKKHASIIFIFIFHLIPTLVMVGFGAFYYFHSMRVFMRVRQDWTTEEDEEEKEMDKIFERKFEGKEAIEEPNQ